MQTISAFLPLTRSVAAARLVIDGAGFDAIGPMLGQEIALGAAYALLGYAVFRIFENTSRQMGTLEAF
jgi:ABC-2 type transport system permease protein